ncbi:MAG: SurA N-terminal domain-containing protein, partial [Pseudomonadota bacterium]
MPRDAVAAVVNDAVITTYDVRQRMRLAMISAGGSIPKEALPQLQAQSLRDLIEEKLKLQETAKFEMDFSDAQFAQEFAVLAAQSNLTPEALVALLNSQGVSENIFRPQIEVNILWPDLVQGRYRDRVRISENEVDDTYERMREDVSLDQYLVSELCIPVDDPARAQQYYEGSRPRACVRRCRQLRS